MPARSHETTPDTRPPATPEVTARFQDRDAVEGAVDALVEAGIPPDQIRVSVCTPDGSVRRHIEVKSRMGALRGSLRGAAVGGLTVPAALLLWGAAAYGWPWIAELGSAAVAALLGGAAAGALAGVTIGGILAMGRWTGGEQLTAEDLREGFVRVTVHGDGLQDRARGVLEPRDDAEIVAPARAADRDGS